MDHRRSTRQGAAVAEAPRGEAPGILSPGRVLHGRYRLKRRLGRGGWSDVWLARHLRRGHLCALKLLRPGVEVSAPFASERRAREARMLASLRDPAVAAVRRADPDAAPAYLELEYVAGRSLDGVLRPG